MAESTRRDLYQLSTNGLNDVRRGGTSPNLEQGLKQWTPTFDLTQKYSTPKTPFDRIRGGRQQRAAALGLRSKLQSSFEGNQSFPRLNTRKKFPEGDLSFRETLREVPFKPFLMDRIRGDALHSYSFAPGRHRGSFTPQPERPHSGLDTCSWSLLASSLSGTPAPAPSLHAAFPAAAAVANPNKAVFTVDAKTSQILMVNDTACRLLNYSADELSHMSLRELFRQHRTPQMAMSETQQLDGDGNMVLCSGKVVEMVTREQCVVPVSLWLRRLAPSTPPGASSEVEERCLAVVEPVVRREARLLLDAGGRVLTADAEACLLFQHEPAEMIGLPAVALIPAMQLPQPGQPISKEVRKQKATGRTKDGTSFPLSLRIKESLSPDEVDNANTSMLYSATIWVFTSMSGLIAVSKEGVVESCNHHFAKMMFGYSQDELVGQPITMVIPNFCEDLERIDGSTVTGYEDDYEDDTEEEEEHMGVHGVAPLLVEPPVMSRPPLVAETPPGSTSPSPDNNNLNAPNRLAHSFHQLTLHSPKHRHMNGGATTEQSQCKIPHANVFSLNPQDQPPADYFSKKQHSSSCSLDCLEGPINGTGGHSTPIRRPSCHLQPPRCTSANEMLLQSGSSAGPSRFHEGSYIGIGKHRDGACIDIVYQVRRVQLSSGRMVLCVWVSRDPDEVATEGGNCMTLTSSFNSTVDNSLGQAIRSCAQQQQPPQPPPPQQQNVASQTSSAVEEEYCSGEYTEHYATLQQIGKGAFGCVKMAYRKQDGLLVITKFIEKSKVYQESWVDDTILRRKVPLEISLLTALNHPNIVQVVDVFENDLYFQMVMKKHGSGMDLFEFIDRDPDLDEPLASYIFRQIVSAVDYLHSLQILHRDLKDENVILDQNFHVKLIDFGSATFMREDRLFSTFYGTVEYCSPEVLAGNKYAGPELEMWSLGVTLYIMAFGENPFYDVDETVKAELHPPYEVSAELMQLLAWMLAKDPRERCRLPQVQQHPWLNIPVDPRNYRFEDVVQCTAMEAHPPMYYSELMSSEAVVGSSGPLSCGLAVALGPSGAVSPSRRKASRPSAASARSERSRGGSSGHSPYSLTTVENFEDEEDDPDDLNRLTPLEPDCMEPRGRSVTPEAGVSSSCLGKVEHRCEGEQGDTWVMQTPPTRLMQVDQEQTAVGDSNWEDYYHEEDRFS